MAEDAKSIRRTAKARFTRKRNELLKSIDADQGREMVEGNYVKLFGAWDIAESKHDLYTMYLTDEELEVAERWITELQELFAEATALKIQYIQNSVRSEVVARETTLRHESEMKERAERERRAEKALIMRTKAQTVFDTICNNTKHFLDNNIGSHTLERSLKQIEDAYAECKIANDDVLDLADRDTAENAIKFAAQIQCRLDDMTEKLTSRIGPKDDQVARRETCTSTNFQLEKIKLPRFEGEIRAYPQFKRDFEKQIMPHLQSDNMSYVLRSSLGSDPATTVKSIDDDISEMWKRLDEKYGDPAKVADVIIDGIRRTRIIREGEEKRFVEFVEIVEDGYRDLKRLGLESEITTTSSVSIIEKKLPADIRRKWAEIVSADNSTVDKTNKFPSLLKFLRNQRGAIEYDTASLRVPAGPVKAVIHHTTAREEIDMKGKRMTQGKCLIHEGGKHSTEECKVYSSKSLDEKKTILKEKNACWSCLKVGHRSRVCRAKKICNIKDCPLTHHQSLHEERQMPNMSSASGPTNVCNNTETDTCLLQVQKIKTKRGTVNVMWDNAASLCFVTNSKAKEQNLKGKKVDLSIIKIGAQDEKINTMKYILPLVDAQGQIVHIDAYGIDKITSDIESVSTENLANLFKGVSKDDIARPAGPVDVLIGYEYAAYHPQRTQNVGHLLLLENRFGLCIGGTHPSIKDEIKKHDLSYARVQHVIKVEDFYKIENLGVECVPRCGSCKCGHCAVGSKNYSSKEEKELELIEKNMKFDAQDNR
ncbi:myosin-2 heavy chain-like [Montipora foliosa]|uniref:myosin-2 heavy chain-like n=1 Tax=Montipora foliosa TaxID=591990 RepID=UPI0035F1AFC5